MDPTTTTAPTPTRQPSSFPFLLVTGLLFYFFSRSPSAPHGHARENLIHALSRRQDEILGLKDWLNSTTPVEIRYPTHSNTSTNLTDAQITQRVCSLSNDTFGIKPLTEGTQFIKQWIDEVQNRADRNKPRLYWRNLTGHIRSEWNWRDESADWYPESLNDRVPSINSTSDQQTNLTAFNSSFVAQRGQFPWVPYSLNQTKSGETALMRKGIRKMGYNLRESPRELIRSNASLIRGSMYFSAPDSRDVSLDVEGIHFQDSGTLYLRAWPENLYLDTRNHLASALDPTDWPTQAFNESLSITPLPTVQQTRIGQVILADLEERVRKVQAMLKKGDIPHDNDEPDSSDNDLSANCTFLIYASLTPLSTSHTQNEQTFLEYEDSLSKPTGASIPTPSPAQPMLQSLMFSPNCGLILEMKEAPMILTPWFWSKGRLYGWIAGVIAGFQCWLLVWQMDSRQSPSSLSRISYLSLVTQVVMDAWIFSSHLTLSVVTNNGYSQALLIPAFFACLSAILFGMRYGTLIRMYAPSTPTPSPPTQVIPDTNVRDEESERLIQNPSDHIESSSETQALIDVAQIPTDYRRSRFRRIIGFLFNLIPGKPFFIVGAISSSILCIPFVLYTWQQLILCILYSYWIPQVVHNVKNGTGRRGLRKRYVIGSTLCRLYLPLYVWGCPHNAFSVTTNPWIWVLAIYSILQATILVLQDYLGARFFLFASCFPYGQTWDYHPVQLPTLTDLEVGGTNQKMPECVICFESIDAIPVDDRHPTRSRSEIGIFSRWSYMVPPCHHIAHTRCLEAWLAIKSECPVCRRPLPPV